MLLLKHKQIHFFQFTIENRERVVRETAKFQISHDDKTEKEKAISEINKKITYFVNIFDRMKKELNKHTLYEVTDESYIGLR